MDRAKLKCSGMGKSAFPRWISRGPSSVASMGIEECKSRPVGISLCASQAISRSGKISSRSEICFLWISVPSDRNLGLKESANLRRALAGSVRKEGQRPRDGEGMGRGESRGGRRSWRSRSFYVLE